MPVELIAFTSDCRIRGAIPLADDRVSDMLNSVPRVVIRGALIEDLVDDAPSETADVTLAIGSIVAILVAGRRGMETRRRKTETRHARIGLTRFVVSGSLHVPAGTPDGPRSGDPAVVLAGRDVLVPLTDASITYDRADTPTTEQFETILINRSHAKWIDLDAAPGGDDGELIEERPKIYHAAIVEGFSRAR